ncbi:MAG: bifunctional demethylmenaquinone methyltransferase/2-methoxy-6-polyprenyl-1,4-benzoquinol methylase [Gammaproteobacteria bacterium 28-57-27]|nr:MAG: bifunctional demethylmenaquinone methyltransferase/2-methoxy-6-polyprenyl-1,4-benzoquinol methylase [Gammaproteobacteria bacterium 28-57-27]
MNNTETQHDTTHFGYRQVPLGEKAKLVRGVFDSVAGKYDLMNDLMSLGIHRLWKRITLARTGLRPGMRALDLAGGTGDLSSGMLQQVGRTGLVVLSDINAEMLTRGRDRLINEGASQAAQTALVNAEAIPFADNSFDAVTISFGLRNVTDKDKALAEMLRVLKPGGRALVLEFSHPRHDLTQKLYDLYSFKALPLIGKFVAKDEASYQYLAESIRMHPDQDTLLVMMQYAGFAHCDYLNMSDGIVALHWGFKA